LPDPIPRRKFDVSLPAPEDGAAFTTATYFEEN
jgi:hypothetical protein